MVAEQTSLRRRMVQGIIHCWVEGLYLLLHVRLAGYKRRQKVLAERYGLAGCQPEPYGEITQRRIQGLAAASQEPANFAWTSGTTHRPKQIFYPKSRIRALQLTSVEQMALAYQSIGVGRPAFYFLTSMMPDHSVSSLLAHEVLPKVLAEYILPYSVVCVPEAEALGDRYSPHALHLAAMLLSGPVLIAMANPSALSVLLENIQQDWQPLRAEITGILKEAAWFSFRQRMGPSIDDREARVRKLLALEQCPSTQALFPKLRIVYCWHGGYVQPFIDTLRRQLADIPVTFFPMFSMSTETVAYLVYPRITLQGGLPIYPGVCYEFLPVGQPMTEANLLKPWQLEQRRCYSMVVSDAYGLKRYHTEDAFECLGFKRHTPILRFLNRVGLNYSFTGEKITDQQLLEVYDTVRQTAEVPRVAFTCFPKLNRGGVPGYVFVCLAANTTPRSHLSAESFDQALMQVNEEYAGKRKSGRLAKPELVIHSYELLVTKLMRSDPRYAGASPAQFKPLPLYPVFWENLANLQGKKGCQ